MNDGHYLDPLGAARSLLALLTGKDGNQAAFRELAARIDALVYSLRFLESGSAAAVPQTASTPTDMPNDHWRDIVSARFPTLGYYSVPLSSIMTSGAEPSLSVGDAIDDLTDIANELAGVEWYLASYGRSEALAALRWSYVSHLHMHLLPLRFHLEERLFEG